jgi:hypothetical protein
MKQLAYALSVIAVVAGMFFLAYIIDNSRIQQDTNPVVVVDSLRTARVLADTNNIRIQQWRHYFEVDSSHINRERREFYYGTVKQMFLDAGFSEAKARIYAEMPTVESNWKATAKSKAGALGLWQFMPATALEYGVKEEDLKDPFISTVIAINYIKDLDSLMHGDVARVLFSYNGGLGIVNSHMDKYQTKDVWLIPFASRETYDFAPKVIGAYLAMNRE